MGVVDDLRLGRPRFKRWLERCRGHGFAHGHELVLELGTADESGPGLGDNVYEADQTLRTAVACGLVESTGCRPTTEQRFFGVGGLTWRGEGHKNFPYFASHLSTHGFVAREVSGVPSDG